MKFKIKVTSSNINNFQKLNLLLNSFAIVSKIIILPKKKKRFVLIKSPHVNKKSKEHFESIKHKRLYYVSFTSLENLKLFFLEVPINLSIKCKKIDI